MGPGQSLRVCLIHEIAHAVSSLGHGKEWQDRVEKAARKAETIGETSVAEALREEIRSIPNPLPLPNRQPTRCTARIKDECLGCPSPSFDEVVDCIRNDCGLTREEFLRQLQEKPGSF